MANLLPPEAKASIRDLYRNRFVFAAGLVALAVALLSMLALLPSYLALRINDSYSVLSTDMSQNASSGVSDRAVLAHTQGLLTQVNALIAATSTPADAVALALSEQPKGLLITHIHYISGKRSEIDLAGNADAPETIQAYQKVLAAETLFTSATVPVGDLVGASGNQFTLKLMGNF